MKGQPLYGCLTLNNRLWKTIKRKINPQIKIRQIIRLNNKLTKIPIFEKFEMTNDF